MQANLRLAQVRTGKHFIGATGGFDHSHLGLVDLFHRLVALHIGAAHQWDLAIDPRDWLKKAFF